MLTRSVLLLAISFGLTGCVTKNNYGEKLARTTCDRYEECARGEFEDDYSSIADCVDDRADNILTDDITVECLDQAGCEFRADNASDCRQSIAQATCEEFVEGDFGSRCDDIWDCTNEQAFDALQCRL